MTCSKSAANTLGLFKQNNTIDTCATDVKQIMIQFAINAVNEITETMTCLESTANASESCKRDKTDYFMLMILDTSLCCINRYNDL